MTKQRDSLGVQRRWSILERYDFTCQFCGSRPGNEHLHVDHLLPHSLGGSDHDNNLASACDRCNSGKSDRVAVPSSMLDGFVSSDGWRTWKRWGDWHLMFDPAVMVLTFRPDADDYWIPHNRFHEDDWHEHIEWKPWMRDDADIAVIEAHHEKLQGEHEAKTGRSTLTISEYMDESRDHALECHPARGERWFNFRDAIDFARTLVRRRRE